MSGDFMADENATQSLSLDEATGAITGLLEGNQEAPKEEPKAEAQPETPETEQPTEEPPQDETPQESEGDTEETEKEAAEQTDAQKQLSTLHDLADALGVEVTQLNDIRIPTKIDGQEGEASLAQLVKGYQLEGHLNRKSMELSDAQKRVESERAQVQQQVSQRIQQLDDVILGLSAVLQEGDSDLAQIKEEQGTEAWLEAKERQRDREGKIQRAFEERQRYVNDQQGLQQQKYQQYLQSQREKLPELIPEWKDAEKVKTETTKITNYLADFGYSHDEIGKLNDARHVAIARKAMLYDEIQKAKPGIAKRVSQLPKVQTPGTTASKADKAAQAASEERSRFKKTGSQKDAEAYLKRLLKVN